METILKPIEVDFTLRWPMGRAEKLAKKGLLPHIILPDGSIRFRENDIEAILQQRPREDQS